MPSSRARTRRHNIVFVLPGPKGVARQKTTVEECLSLYLRDNMIDLIVKYTNIKNIFLTIRTTLTGQYYKD